MPAQDLRYVPCLHPTVSQSIVERPPGYAKPLSHASLRNSLVNKLSRLFDLLK